MHIVPLAEYSLEHFMGIHSQCLNKTKPIIPLSIRQNISSTSIVNIKMFFFPKLAFLFLVRIFFA